jgi:hypothetical protein
MTLSVISIEDDDDKKPDMLFILVQLQMRVMIQRQMSECVVSASGYLIQYDFGSAKKA